MRTPHWTFALSLAAVSGLALPAQAGPKGSEASRGPAAAAHGAAPAAKGHAAAAAKAPEAAKSKGHEADEDHGNGKAEREDHGNADKDKDKDKADKDKDEHGEHKGPPEAVRKKLEQLRATRKERRAARLAKIKQKWGGLVTHPAVRAELKVHAWRMARLDRVRELAAAEDKTDVVARVDKLIAKEEARHDKHMGVLNTKGAR
jgi:hypothetical protein